MSTSTTSLPLIQPDLIRPELLLPAGDPEKLRYAIAYGANAVYLGLPMASLRTPSRGQQFTPDNLEASIAYTHQQSVKAYITINIFPSNRDLDRVIPHLEQMEGFSKASRPDAIIFSDPGIYRLAKRYAPSIPLHLSTQANTLNTAACAFWQDLGVERVILAREVPVREIREIHEALPDLELECFVHGSLCVAYSGRCVISDYLTDNTKNSNKGMCGNSCRWEFEPENELKSIQMKEASRPHEVYTFEEDDKGSYMLNSKDLCLVQHLKALRDAGIVSFKVEGRTKSLYYVATAGRIYSEALTHLMETNTSPSEEQATQWIYELSMAGNRGFTEGFFNGKPDHTAYRYEDSSSAQGAAFLATTLQAETPVPLNLLDQPVALIQARNPFSVGEQIDWITPSSNISAPLTALWDSSGLTKTQLQTNQTGWIRLPDSLPVQEVPWLLIRRKHITPCKEDHYLAR